MENIKINNFPTQRSCGKERLLSEDRLNTKENIREEADKAFVKNGVGGFNGREHLQRKIKLFPVLYTSHFSHVLP